MLAAPEVIYLYVDGSCLGNQNVDSQTPAGWGLVIVSGDTGLGKGTGELIEEKSGKVERVGQVVSGIECAFHLA